MADEGDWESIVTVRDDKAIVCIDSHLISLFSVDAPYLGKKSVEFSNRLQNPIQTELWARHVAWTAVDYLGGGNDIEKQFSLLANFTAELIDPDCLGIYVPSESSLIPNDTELYTELKRIAAFRDINAQSS
jgi:hypothetical protein